MSDNTIRLGHEGVAHGTLAVTLKDFPASYRAHLDQAQYIPQENRTDQDEAFQAVPSWQHEQWEMDGDVYHDMFGYILAAALGAPTKVLVGGESAVWDESFVPAADPWSLSLQWQQTIDYVQAFQSLNAVLDELEIEFGAQQELHWRARGFSMPETNIGQLSAPTLQQTKPNVNWQGAVTLGGGGFASLTYAKLTWKRNRAPFFAINNTQAPKRMRKGMRSGSIEIIVDPDAAGVARYTAFKNGTKEAFNVVFNDAATLLGAASSPKLTIDVPNSVWKAATIDVGGDTPLIHLTADKFLYDVTAGYAMKGILRTSQDYTTL